jgi:hypothetical protein
VLESLDKKGEEDAIFCLRKDGNFFPLFLSPIRQSTDTKKIQSKYVASFVLPSLVFFLGPLVVWPKVGEHTELLRISKE